MTKTTPLVTYEAVAQAAEAIQAEGGRPSVRAVRARLEGGSPNVIAPLLAQWKAGRPVVHAEEVQIDPRISQILAEQIGKAVLDARGDVEARLVNAEADLEAVSRAGRDAEELAQHLAGELEIAKSRIQTLRGQIDQLKADAERGKADAAEQIKATEGRAAAGIAKAEEEAARERQGREAAQAALARAELRLETVPRLEKEIERLQVALDAERTARADAERQVATAEAKSEGLAARLMDTQEQNRQIVATLESRLQDQKQLVEALQKRGAVSKPAQGRPAKQKAEA